MYRFTLVTICFTIFFQSYRSISIDEVFRDLYIVPDLIDETPKKLCNVTYHDKTGKMFVLRPGQFLPAEYIESKPRVTWPAESNRTYYTLYLAGITKWIMHFDYRGIRNLTGTTYYPFGYEWHNWVVGNILDNDFLHAETLYEFQTPMNPAKEEITDRYVFFVFRQKAKIKFDPPTHPEKYAFSEHSMLRDFVKKYNLGYPVFGNCFLSKWVPPSTRADKFEGKNRIEIQDNFVQRGKTMGFC